MGWSLAPRLMMYMVKSGHSRTHISWLAHTSWRACSTAKCSDTRNISSQPAPHHKVLVSSSMDIYENLALEDWLFEKTDLTQESVLLLWRNRPAVVIGRHQNPFLECNLPSAKSFDVDIARRKSGGGTVYHDEGNLNCSFLVKRGLYNRRKNLEFIVDVLKSRGSVDLMVNDREDIVLDGKYKVSGTASRLSGQKTYHHFTLLCDVDKDRLGSILYTNMEDASSKATPSVRMSVGNLSDALHVDFDSVVNLVSDRYLHQHANAKEQYIAPMDESRFPGISQRVEELRSWEWIYGKCPPFSVCRTFTNLIRNVNANLTTSADVVKGQIHNLDITLIPVPGVLQLDPSAVMLLKVGLEQTRLEWGEVSRNMSQVKMDWISKQLYTVETQPLLDWVLLCVLETLSL